MKWNYSPETQKKFQCNQIPNKSNPINTVSAINGLSNMKDKHHKGKGNRNNVFRCSSTFGPLVVQNCKI